MPAYWIPPPVRGGPADASHLGVERWACGVCASDTEWPPGEYEWRLPSYGLPLYAEHRAEAFVPSGLAPADVGAVRRLADIGGLVACLIEVTSPAVVWDLAQGKRCGLSVMAHLEEPPGGGITWVYFSEISLTSTPKDPLARVVSTGELALRDWETLTGEPVAALAEDR